MSKIVEFLTKLWPTNPGNRTTQLLVSIVVMILIGALFTKCANANDNVYPEVGFGSTVIRGETSAVDLALRWKDTGPGDADLLLGVTFIGPTSENIDGKPQFAWRAEVVDGYKNFEVGLGLAYLRVTDRFNCGGTNFSLRLGYVWKPYLKSYLLHYSNGGTCYPNLGRDMIFPLAFTKRW